MFINRLLHKIRLLPVGEPREAGGELHVGIVGISNGRCFFVPNHE
jgi:hypothetical protein